MARQPQVTRTIKTTNATLMCVDTIAGEVHNETILLPRTYDTEKDLMKAATKVYAANPDKENIKIVAVVNTEVAETLYGMSEADFITNAKVLPPRSGDSANPDEE